MTSHAWHLERRSRREKIHYPVPRHNRAACLMCGEPALAPLHLCVRNVISMIVLGIWMARSQYHFMRVAEGLAVLLLAWHCLLQH